MLRMRLQRFGRKHDPYYRVVIASKDAPVKGKYVSSIGHYNPAREIVEINKDKALEWLGKGVQPSNRVARLLTKLGVKHKLVVVKTFRTKTKQELEAQKKAEEAAQAKEIAEKEKAKREWERKAADEAKQQKAEAANKTEVRQPDDKRPSKQEEKSS